MASLLARGASSAGRETRRWWPSAPPPATGSVSAERGVSTATLWTAWRTASGVQGPGGTGVGPSCPPSSTDPRLPVVVETVQTHRQCPGVVLSPCNATSNTVCATETDRGRPENKRGSEFLVPWVTVSVILAVAVVVGVYWYKKKGVRVSYQPIVRLLKGRSDGPGVFPLRSNSQLETVQPEAPPAPGTETQPQPAEEESLALMPEARPHPGPSGESEESPELQALVVGGSPVVQEQTLEASAPAAPEPQDGTQASPSLKSLEERYKKEYFVKDNSKEATATIHYEFVKSSMGNDWKMFMRLIGLDETDIDSCECENPGNLMEQRHKMLFTWRKKLGKEASVFKLLAALHKLGLQMYLQNIINNLVAEGILGRHVGTSD
ncbi:uncharacterized protein LOC131488315 isoform X2 [Neofelis nebulosa]|uniref:uncharacterized protein LOC131488315 isoform X2 n=1 Tax=Neofelis nebulosa TaxID=61452 RepID=UPI00272A8E70|nr:uncharacterized protein LOC131488315 isoform X2 [Neofelis nebulosa]